MSFKFNNVKKQCWQDEWQFVVPRVGHSISSPNMLLEDQAYILSFETSWLEVERDDIWTMKFTKVSDNSIYPRFLMTTHIKTEDEYLFLSYNVISSKVTTILSSSQQQFFRKYPGVDYSEKTLVFVFTFYDGIQNCESKKKEHRSVQTPAYFDDRRCLENLSRDFAKLLEADGDSDVVLECGDCTLPAHKLVLGSRSEVLRNMLQSDMREGRRGSVRIVDMRPDVLRVFIRYLYTGSLPELTEGTAVSLFEAGDKYLLDALRGRCSEFLAENLTRENACAILVLADAHSDEDLKSRVVSYVLDEKIPNDDCVWPKFCESHPKLAIEVLSRAYKQSASL